MNEQSILITGCSSGIGLCAAQTLKVRGWRVFATARKPADIARLKDEEGIESLYLDYAEPRSIATAADYVLAATEGRLTALFNNGGYGQPGAVEDLKPHVLRAQFEANVFGWHDLTCRVVPAMRARSEGRIVFCSSVLGLIAAPYRGAYCASKFAVEALADTLRIELTGTGVEGARDRDDTSVRAPGRRIRVGGRRQPGPRALGVGRLSRRLSPAPTRATPGGTSVRGRSRDDRSGSCRAPFVNSVTLNPGIHSRCVG